MGEDWEFKIQPYLIERGARRVGVVGTCFGSYIVIHTHVFGGDLMRGGVSIHPGHPTQMATEGEDEGALYSHITAPQYFMATPDSSNQVRPGGLADQIIETHLNFNFRLCLMSMRVPVTMDFLTVVTSLTQ